MRMLTLADRALQNLIAIGGIAASLSVAAALVKHDVPGRVVLLGTPAEEGEWLRGVATVECGC